MSNGIGLHRSRACPIPLIDSLYRYCLYQQLAPSQCISTSADTASISLPPRCHRTRVVIVTGGVFSLTVYCHTRASQELIIFHAVSFLFRSHRPSHRSLVRFRTRNTENRSLSPKWVLCLERTTRDNAIETY